MKSLREKVSAEEILDGFFNRLKKAKHPLLLLDYDGTLAPFVENRDMAFPYPAIVPIIEDIQDNTRSRVVIISGRAVHDLLDLIKMNPNPEIWGSHGLERLTALNEYEKKRLSQHELEVLDSAEKAAGNYIEESRIERKPASVAAHFRGMKDKEKNKSGLIRNDWRRIIEKTNFEIHDFDGGIELRLSDINKGVAVEKIFEENAEYVGAYLGDDWTDEDAFKALPEGNLAVLVRPEYRETGADIWIHPPEELKHFLSKWLTTLS